jgi:hypothetical protein
MVAQMGSHIATTSTQSSVNKKKGVVEVEDNKEIQVDHNNLDKKFKISSKLNPK